MTAEMACAGHWRAWAAAALLLGATLSFYGKLAWAQAGQPNNCSGTVGVTAAAVSYPAAGATGPSMPTQYVTIANPHASNNLCVNVTPGGTAECAAAGSMTIAPNGSASWWLPAYRPPASISIIASGADTPYTCMYQ